MSLFLRLVSFILCVLCISAPSIVQAKTYYMNTSPVSMFPRDEAQLYTKTPQFLATNSQSPSNFYHAQLFLPDGAVLTEFKVWLRDTDATQDVHVQLERTHITGLDTNELCSVDSAQVNSELTSLTCTPNAQFATVDNSTYTYDIQLTLPPSDSSDVLFRSAQLTYEATPAAVVVPLY